jgi:tetratricopeptide (TPR) repeat protein
MPAIGRGQQTVSESSQDAEALVEEGLQLYSQGQLDEALSRWRRALSVQPDLGLALEYIKYVEENRAALESTFAAALQPDEADTSFLDFDGVAEPASMEADSAASADESKLKRGPASSDRVVSSGGGPSPDAEEAAPVFAEESGRLPVASDETMKHVIMSSNPAPDQTPIAAAPKQVLTRSRRSTPAWLDESPLAQRALGDEAPPLEEDPERTPVSFRSSSPGLPAAEIREQLDELARSQSPVVGEPLSTLSAPSTGPVAPHLRRSSDALEPEAVFEIDNEELVDEVTPASMIKRGHKPPPADHSRRSPLAPPPIPAAALQVPTPEPRDQPRRKKRDSALIKKLQIKADDGFIGLDDLLTTEEEQSPSAPTQHAGQHDDEDEGPTVTGHVPEKGRRRRRQPMSTVEHVPLDRHEPEVEQEDDDPEKSGIADADRVAAQAQRAGSGQERVDTMLSGAEQLHQQGTFEGSLWLCEKILTVEPDNAKTLKLLKRNQEILLKQYESRLSDLSAVPVIQVPQQEIVWHKLDHRAGFLLSRVDGMLSFDDILDISGMGRFEATRILAQLIEQGVIGTNR